MKALAWQIFDRHTFTLISWRAPCLPVGLSQPSLQSLHCLRKPEPMLHISVNELLLWMKDSATALECGEAIVIA